MLSRTDRQRLRRRAARILDASGSDLELSLVLAGDLEVHALNRDFRGVDRTTDVLSFSQLEGQPSPVAEGALGLRVLGDVVISVEQAARQAEGGLEAELLRLIAHGLCHLRGYDHARARDAKAMQAEEARLLAAGVRRGAMARPLGCR
jgi:probable rRNA maturation factor